MPNWIDDNLDLANFPKTNVTPPPATGLTGVVTAADMNSVRQALQDIQAFLRATVRSYLTNANAGTVAAGTPVYASSGGHFDKAIASASATALCIGLVAADVATGAVGGVQHGNALTLTTAQWDARTGGSGGLTPGATYYVSAATAGALTTVAPSAVGQFIVPIGFAFSTTQMRILNGAPIGL